MKQLMSRASGAVLPGVLVVSLCFPLAAHAATCESLARLTLDNTKITIAQEVAPGTFTPPGVARQGGAPPQVPRAYASLPANELHFAHTQDGAVVQIVGIGPFEVTPS